MAAIGECLFGARLRLRRGQLNDFLGILGGQKLLRCGRCMLQRRPGGGKVQFGQLGNAVQRSVGDLVHRRQLCIDRSFGCVGQLVSSGEHGVSP